MSRLRARAEVAASLPGPQPQEQPGADGKVFFLLGPFHTQPRCYARKEVVSQLPSLLSESSGHDAGTRTTHPDGPIRSEEHTYELQSLMRSSYAVFGLKKKNT